VISQSQREARGPTYGDNEAAEIGRTNLAAAALGFAAAASSFGGGGFTVRVGNGAADAALAYIGA
jgi:hypothetical protein